MHVLISIKGDCLDTYRSTDLPPITRCYLATTHLSHSSVEAKSKGVANVVVESCSLCSFFIELHFLNPNARLVYYDNINAIYIYVLYPTKHIEMDDRFVSYKVAKGQVYVFNVPSKYQIAIPSLHAFHLFVFKTFKIVSATVHLLLQHTQCIRIE